MLTSLLAGVAAGYAIAIPVGAIAAYLITLGARRGWRVASGGAIGAATVDGVYAAAAVTAGGMLAPAIVAVQEPLRWLSVVVLLTLGAMIIRPALRPSAGPARPRRLAGTPASAGSAFLTVAGLTLVNPLTLVYFAALTTGLELDFSTGSGEPLIFVLGAFASSASWQLLLTSAGSSMGRLLTGARGHRVSSLIGGGMVALLALKAALGW